MRHPSTSPITSTYPVFFAESAQNTFLLCDCLPEKDLSSVDLKGLHALLLQEGKDDALLLLNGQKQEARLFADYFVLGCDGDLAEFCGNGARALSAYLHTNYPKYKEFALKTSRGIYPLKQLENDDFAALLPFPSTKWNPKFISDWMLFQQEHPNLVYTEVMEPHLTVHQSMRDEELFKLGRTLNQKKDLFPCGINISAWDLIEEKTLHVKTYERGVQRLTRSCGTGSIACTLHAKLLDQITVKTPGGLVYITWSSDGVLLSGTSTIEKTSFTIDKVLL